MKKAKSDFRPSINIRTRHFLKWANFATGKSSRQEDIPCDYREYRLSLKEWALAFSQAVGILGVTAYLYYRSLILFFFLLPFAFLYPGWKKKKYLLLRRERLRLEFKEAIKILSASLAAGYAVENAFRTAVGELSVLYGEDGMITVEFRRMVKQVELNKTVEEVFLDFGRRSGVAEIMEFAEIFAISKRSRGELVPVVAHVVKVISDRITLKEEIQTMTAQKRLEQTVMNVMPYAILFYIDVTSPGFLSPMYETIPGRLVMTVCLILYLSSVCLARYILRIGEGG